MNFEWSLEHLMTMPAVVDLVSADEIPWEDRLANETKMSVGSVIDNFGRGNAYSALVRLVSSPLERYLNEWQGHQKGSDAYYVVSQNPSFRHMRFYCSDNTDGHISVIQTKPVKQEVANIDCKTAAGRREFVEFCVKWSADHPPPLPAVPKPPRRSKRIAATMLAERATQSRGRKGRRGAMPFEQRRSGLSTVVEREEDDNGSPAPANEE